MFEYWFLNLTDDLNPEPFDHHATTHDFLQVCTDIAKLFGFEVTGQFVAALLDHLRDQIDFLRVADWKFDHHVKKCGEVEQIIRLHKLI